MSLQARLWILLLLALPAMGKARQAKPIQSAYAAAGGMQVLSSIPEWRIKEKKALLQYIVGLPEAAKKELCDSADQVLRVEWPQLKYSDYREFKLSGNRSRFEAKYFGRRGKLNILCVAELVDGKGKYLDAIVDGLWLVMEESTWVLPAHQTSAEVQLGPDPAKPVVDLYAAETSATLAWVKFLLGDQLNKISPVLLTRIDNELEKRVVLPYLATDYWWTGLADNRKQTNWNIWINSNVLKMAALAIDNEDTRLRLIEKTMRSADRFPDTYAPDGGCEEGPAYWQAAGGCLGEYLVLLSDITGGKMQWKENTLIHNIGKYIAKVHIDSNRFVNFADAPGSLIPDPARVYSFGRLFDDNQIKSFAAYLSGLQPDHFAALGAYSLNFFVSRVKVDSILRTIPAKAPMLKESWFPDLQVLNLRKKEGDEKGLSFIAKGGHNAEIHNHNDVGSFLLYLDGSPVLVDPGVGRYTRQSFSADRYKLWYTQSQWHNCPSINGQDQLPGAAYAAKDVQFEPGKRTDVFSMELAKAYGKDAAVNSWLRTFNYTPAKGVLILQDQFELKQYVAPSQIRLVACAKPVVLAPGKVKLSSLRGKAILMTYDASQYELKLEEQPIDDDRLALVWGSKLYRLSLQWKGQALKGGGTLVFKE
jgi:hypothetical protein